MCAFDVVCDAVLVLYNSGTHYAIRYLQILYCGVQMLTQDLR